jgi:hypothetical protein
MEHFVGLDVSQELTHLCVISSDGKTVWQGKCSSTPKDIAATIRSKAQDVVRIGLESGPLSTWLCAAHQHGAVMSESGQSLPKWRTAEAT